MNSSLYIFIGIAVIAILLLVLLLPLKKKNNNNFLESFVLHYRPTLGMEKNLDYILLKTQELLEAPSYSFYLFNPTNQRFTLKSVRHLTTGANIAPSYSGLLPYEKEKFEPPLSIAKESVPLLPTFSKEGEVPLLSVPIQGGKGVIRIGPVSKIPKKKMKQFGELSQLLEVPLRNLLEDEEQQRNYKVLETSSKALKHINRLFTHEIEFIKLLVQTCMKFAQPSACLVVEESRIAHSYGIDKHMIQKHFQVELKRVMEDKSFVIVPASAASLILAIPAQGYLAMCQFRLVSKQYYIVFSFDKGTAEVENTRSQAIKLLLSQIQQFIRIKHDSKQSLVAYIHFLKGVADLIDYMSPYTIGASKLMANYSMAIAKEMSLSEHQVQSIGLAAYLSNIGIMGLSDGLLNKDGVYSDKEYEQMQLHSEVGAAIIDHTVALSDVALYVKHHHERMDGNGYPSRIIGEEIPLGSKIIAVVQTFLAKISGRSYRGPLSFEDACQLLADSVGSQLDRQVVTVFLEWYKKEEIPTQKSRQQSGIAGDAYPR